MISIIERNTARAVIVIESFDSEFDVWLATELNRYIHQISDTELPIVSMKDAIPEKYNILLVGSPQNHSWIAKLQATGLVLLDTLQPEGFVVQSIPCAQSTVVVISGLDERALMYATYAFIEQLGVIFQLTKDVIPEKKSDILLSSLHIRFEPAIRHRGFHIRHMVMPWMGYFEFCKLIDQMAKMKCNYLEFYWYEGAPWVEYSYRGEKKQIGDLYSAETGYTAWWIETFAFSSDDVVVGKEHFSQKRPCALEFQFCHTPDEAYPIAKNLLNRMIEYAHTRKIEVWLGAGDCPTVPPNLGRLAEKSKSADMFGYVIPPGDPAGVDIWSSILESMVDTYPQADGYWLWLAESYFDMNDMSSKHILEQYQPFLDLLPTKSQILAMGYDQYILQVEENSLRQGDLGLIHYGKQVIEHIQQSRPQARLGVSLLGRSYLFPVFHHILSPDVRLQSMESSAVWNRNARVPMENFSGMTKRECFLVPRLDDDENELAMQFNVGLYEHDRVLSGSFESGVRGIAPQIGKTRGAEHNARYIADGCWNPHLTLHDFYANYTERTYGTQAKELMLEVYLLLEKQESFLGLEVDIREAGYTCFQGMGNFFNYIDSREMGWLKNYRYQKHPDAGMDWHGLLGSESLVEAHFQSLRYRYKRFSESTEKLAQILALLQQVEPLVNDGSRTELHYLYSKTEAFRLHLQTCCAILQGMLTYEAAYEAKRRGHTEAMQGHFTACELAFQNAYARSLETAHKSASLIDHPTEQHILFRYNVRFVLPIREFQRFIQHIILYHRGQQSDTPIHWEIIDPKR